MRSERHITAPLPLAKILKLDSCIIVPGNFGNAKFGNIFFLTTPGTHMKTLYREWGWSSVAWPGTFFAGNLLVWRGRPLTQKAREKGSGNQPILVLFHWNAAVGMRLLNTLAMAALIEHGVNKGVNTPQSISSTLKVLFPRIPGEWYHSGIG